jgi:hypothetical protein
MNSFEHTLPNGETRTYYTSPDPSKGQPVFLDSGGTLSTLPTPMWIGIASSFPTARCGTNGFCVVDCAVSAMKGTVNFGFGGKTIKVSYKDVIWKVPETSPQLCVLGVLPNDSKSLASLRNSLRPNSFPYRRDLS